MTCKRKLVIFQKNESINFETDSISKYHVDKEEEDLGNLKKIK